MLSFAIGWELWLRHARRVCAGARRARAGDPVILLSLPAGARGRPLQPQAHRGSSHSRCWRPARWPWPCSRRCRGRLCSCTCACSASASRARQRPASSTLLPQTVPPELFTAQRHGTAAPGNWPPSWVRRSRAGSSRSSTRVDVIYLADTAAALTFLVLLLLIKGRQLALSARLPRWSPLSGGVPLHPAHEGDPGRAHARHVRGPVRRAALRCCRVYDHRHLHVGATGLG